MRVYTQQPELHVFFSDLINYVLRSIWTKTDELLRAPMCSIFGARQSSHIGARTFLTMVLTMRPPRPRRAAPQGPAAGSRWPEPFAPLHTSHVLCLRSFSLLLSSLALLGFLVSRVKFTNPYGAPQASNESPPPPSLSLLLSIVFCVHFSFYSRFVFFILYLFLYFLILAFFPICFRKIIPWKI